MKYVSRFWMCLIVTLMICSATQARIVTWSDTTGGLWLDSTKWSPQVVPLLTDTVHITVPGNYSVVVDEQNVEIASLILGDTSVCGTWERPTLWTCATCSLKVHGNCEVRSCGKLQSSGCLLLADSGKTFINAGIIEISSAGSMHLDRNHFVNRPNGYLNIMGNVGVFGDSSYPLINYGLIGGGGGNLQFACYYQDSASGSFYWGDGQLNILDFHVTGYTTLYPGTRLVLSSTPGHIFRATDFGWIDVYGGTTITGDGRVEIIGGGMHKMGADTCLLSSNIVCDFVQVMEGTLLVTPPDSALFEYWVQVDLGAELQVSNTRFVGDGSGDITGVGTLTLDDSCEVATGFSFSMILRIIGSPVYFNPTSPVSIHNLTLEMGANLISSATINTAVLNMNGGTTNATIVVTGQYEWTAGGLASGAGSEIVIDPGITLNVSGSEPKALDSLSLIINGDAHLSGSGTLTVSGGAAISVETGGTLTIGDSITLRGPGDTLYNRGQLTIQSPLDTSVIDMFLLNSTALRTPGTIDILEGSIVECGRGSNEGTVNVESGAVLDFADPWDNEGRMKVADGARCLVRDTLVNSQTGVIDLHGSAVLGGVGTIINRGQISHLSGAERTSSCAVVAGRFRNLANSGCMNIVVDTLLLLNGGENTGEINIQAGAVLCVMGTLNNLPGGVIHGPGSLSIVRFNTVIRSEGSNILLNWTPIPAALTYDIYVAAQAVEDFSQYTWIATVSEPSFVHVDGVSAARRFYCVVAKY